MHGVGDIAETWRKIVRYTRQHGVRALCFRLCCEAVSLLYRRVRSGALRQRLLDIARKYPERPPMVLLPLMDWDAPMRQRPHHMAFELGRLGQPYVFVTSNGVRCHLGLSREGEGCYVTHDLELVLQCMPGAVLHVYSTSCARVLDIALAHWRHGGRVLYEFIDALHPDLHGSPITDEMLERHRTFLRNRDILVVATAHNLWDEVLRERNSDENARLVPNGVDVEDFQEDGRHDPVPQMDALIRAGRPVIGYSGVLASWFDYDLLRYASNARPDYEFVLVGGQYDDSAKHSGVFSLANVHAIGPIAYAELPRYVSYFRVGIIPFVINDITLSTSPIKLYEYMAAGLPVVATALPECERNPLVLTGASPQEFVELLDKALVLRQDTLFRKALREEAGEHSWRSRAAEVANLVWRVQEGTTPLLFPIEQCKEIH